MWLDKGSSIKYAVWMSDKRYGELHGGGGGGFLAHASLVIQTFSFSCVAINIRLIALITMPDFGYISTEFER